MRVGIQSIHLFVDSFSLPGFLSGASKRSNGRNEELELMKSCGPTGTLLWCTWWCHYSAQPIKLLQNHGTMFEWCCVMDWGISKHQPNMVQVLHKSGTGLETRPQETELMCA